MNTGKKRFYVRTFGCQMNVNDSEKVVGLLRKDGLVASERAEDADFVFLNTCAVREKAAAKLYHALSRLRHLQRRRPELRIGVGGCVAQLEGKKVLERAPNVDVLVGTHNVGRVPELLRRAEVEGRTAVDLERRADSFAVAPADVAHSSPVRAYVTVMEGCNHVCSFCVVPRTRGPEVCRAPEEILGEVRAVVARGYREVMLLGQTVNAYRYGSTDFAGLLERVHEVPGLARLRFTTSHPDHVTERLARVLRDLPRLCPYLHLPVQSGSDRVLASMRRGYTRAEYIDTVGLLRAHVPDLALTSDVIVGYPGEGEPEFRDTVSLVEEAAFDGLFVFAYSPRPGTTAFRGVDDVSEDEKTRRLHVLNALQQRAQTRRNQEHLGQEVEVLVERVDGEGRVSGRTRHFRIVHLDGGEDLVGQRVRARITGAGPNALMGKRGAAGESGATDSLTWASSAPIF
jgi:tRNA-2-methylthio-N6-dimethylallyladenosine synthase